MDSRGQMLILSCFKKFPIGFLLEGDKECPSLHPTIYTSPLYGFPLCQCVSQDLCLPPPSDLLMGPDIFVWICPLCTAGRQMPMYGD